MLCYFRSPTCLTATSTVTAVQQGEAGCSLQFAKTVFYPQGGGQPSDKGSVTCHGHSLAVQKVLLDNQQHVVTHHCTAAPQSCVISVGDQVEMTVDAATRKLHNRLHSAGHLVDAAIKTLGYEASLAATKAYHYPDGPYVQYKGCLPEGANTKEELQTQLQKVCIDLIAQNLPVHIDLQNDDPADDRCQRSMRIANLISIPCGGTHVASLGEIGPDFVIRKIGIKAEEIKISYAC